MNQLQNSSERTLTPESAQDQVGKHTPGAARFLRLALNGAHRGASSGEKIANRLAKSLATIGDDLAILDPQIIEGACQVLRRMSGPWKTDADKAAVFKQLLPFTPKR